MLVLSYTTNLSALMNYLQYKNEGIILGRNI